jgi:23S rRNA (cytidine2498-2'-O)-methyltransferase
LQEELAAVLGKASVTVVGPSLVRSQGAPTDLTGEVDVTFARTGFPVAQRLSGSIDVMADAVAQLIPSLDGPWALQAWVPDADTSNPWAPIAAELETRVLEVLRRNAPEALSHRATQVRTGDAILVQAALVNENEVALGTLRASEALSRFSGGRARMHVGGDRPSRATRKLEEALEWLGIEPGPGETCVDLGAAPGGWSWALLQRRTKVIAVDPAQLRPDVASARGLVHIQGSAFDYEPDEPVDWLFCDMAWRPLEVAQLLAKWGRRRWTHLVISNIKLPMRKKAAIVERARAVVASGGFRKLRTRQLYHDRDEITLVAHR